MPPILPNAAAAHNGQSPAADFQTTSILHERRAKTYADKGVAVPENVQRQIDEAKYRAIEAVRAAKAG